MVQTLQEPETTMDITTTEPATKRMRDGVILTGRMCRNGSRRSQNGERT
jgi:hypothetical protein